MTELEEELRVIWSKNGKPYIAKPKHVQQACYKKYYELYSYNHLRHQVLKRIGIKNVKETTLKKYNITDEEFQKYKLLNLKCAMQNLEIA